jgi:hypothetical protein
VSTTWPGRAHRYTTRALIFGGKPGTAGWRSAQWKGHAVTRTPASLSLVALAHLQPDQKTIGQHHRDGMAVKAGSQQPLVLVPLQLPFGLFMKLLAHILPMGIAGQLVHRGRRGQVAPVVFPLLGLPTGGTLAGQPSNISRAIADDPPTAHRHKLLAQPACGPLPPADRAPLPARQGLDELLGARRRAHRLPLPTSPAIRALPPHNARFGLPSLPRNGGCLHSPRRPPRSSGAPPARA